MSDRSKPLIAWSLILPGLVVAVGLAGVALRMHPTASDVAERCATVVALLLLAKLVSWVARSGSAFQREERLLAFVMAASIALSWLGAQQTIHEVAFDDKVRSQKKALVETTDNLSREIASFLDERRRAAPPTPRPATWDRDDAAWVRFENQTTAVYERRFGVRVRAAHDLLSLRNMRDRDLDLFYRLPANDFQISVVAQKLKLLAARLAREDAR